MKLVFLDRTTFLYKDNAEVLTDFELTLDSVVAQKSSFNIYKDYICFKVGDVVVLHGAEFSYLGIVSEITGENSNYKVSCLDFKELFNIPLPIKTYSGDLCLLLKKMIEESFKINVDPRQNLSYLNIIIDTSIEGELSYEDDTLINLKDLIELLFKAYGLVLNYKVSFIRGRFSSIDLILTDINDGVSLRYDFAEIRNLKISDSSSQIINKITFYPSSENITRLQNIEYCLLKDGSVTTNKDDLNRYDYVNSVAEIYKDDEFDNLETKAISKLCVASCDHEISFNLNMDNKVFVPLKNIFPGDYVKFYAQNKQYYTVLTKVKFKNSFNEVSVSLGEQRSSLTDKIKLLNKNNNNTSNTYVSSQINFIDGGNY